MIDLKHSGVPHDENPPGRGSGRYGWGTGENPYQHQFNFLSEVKKMKSQGISDANIAKALLGENANSTDLRAEISIQRAAERKVKMAEGYEMLQKCHGNMSEAARRLGMKNESSLRSLLNPAIAERTDRYQQTAEELKKAIKEKKYIDVSTGSELYLGVPDYTKKVAIAMLEKEGYVKTWVQVPQSDPNKKTTIMVLAAPGTPKSEIQANKYEVKPITDYTPDEGKTWWTPEFPESVSSDRIMVRYAEEGGVEKDGVIELRRGVDDLSLGNSQYAQVRIAVDGTHYLKGMAMYADEKDLPDGIDIICNTNKKKGTPMIGEKDHEVLKRMKIDTKTGEVDRENPFGALIKSPKDRDGIVTAGGQSYYIDKDGKKRLSKINKLQDEGDWDSWSRNLSSQFLSKQPIKIIKQQIDLSVAEKKAELDEILRLDNPVIKKKLLEDFSNGCDANAASLSVKGFKNQAFQVLLPIPSLKDNEIYAPNFTDGDTVILVRYPHGGTFEIPVLKVNNRNAKAKKIMGGAHDAVGINSHNAEILSGADFDGDTALVIPVASNNLNIKTSPQLDGLKDFDPKTLYKLPDDAPGVKNKTKQTEMGKVTNLINDMTVGGASLNDIEKAVKHSMVVIDSEKHRLDYKQSEKDNDIINLKKTYQGLNPNGTIRGASTILSRSKASVYVDKYKEVTDTKKMTPEELERWNAGKKVLRPTGEKSLKQIKNPAKMTPEELKLYEAGKKVYREDKNKQTKVHQMDVVDDAMDLVRDKTNDKELAYAKYANDLKALADQARREYRAITPIPVNQSAKKAYSEEVASLNDKLKKALMNAPKERQAQLIANAQCSIKFKDNPDMDFEHRQRARALALNSARAQVGAKKDKIVITDREWEAIQANAISTNRLQQILNNTDQDAFKKRATPRNQTTATKGQVDLAAAMWKSGMYTQKDIADRLGVSTSYVMSILK